MIIVKTENTEMFLKKKKLLQRTFICIIAITLFFINNGYSQNQTDSLINKQISKAILDGNANDLSILFHSQVDMVLPQQSGIFSKVQAKFILKEFFKTNIPESFNIITQDANKGSNFIVAKLHTVDQHYRVCFLTKKTLESTLIYQIIIEK
ncbi:MAG: DUF4783 domain-containing protein [Salinivirgaceae bacterium]|nr:DUF4783 domain-containing protein [Salinivirgaceae bacterium]